MHDQFAAITDKMHRMEVNHANRFQLLREAFNVPTREHEDVIRNTKEKILNMAQNFSAEVTVDGKSSYSFDLLHGLIIDDNSGLIIDDSSGLIIDDNSGL